jgi:hypothetical protein
VDGGPTCSIHEEMRNTYTIWEQDFNGRRRREDNISMDVEKNGL